MTKRTKILALTGGVGGAKLGLGLSRLLPIEQLTIVVNTGDDFEHLGLNISPDLDTTMYTLAGLSNQTQGWGLEGERWETRDMLAQYGAETWFQLGNKDIATHIVRTNLLSEGWSLTAITQLLFKRLGVEHRVLPMTDNRVRTIVETPEGDLAFQHYFVKEQCQPMVKGFRFDGAEQAEPQPEFIQELNSDDLKAVIVCPSNPFVSVNPILQLPRVRDALMKCKAPLIAVSPIVGGRAIKGPTAKMMRELNMPSTVNAVAKFYEPLLDGLVIDQEDAAEAQNLASDALKIEVAPTVMKTTEDKVNLAKRCLAFVDTF